MRFKQTAVLGLSALLLGGYMAPPLAGAASVGLKNEPNAKNQLNEWTDHHLNLAATNQGQSNAAVQHPIQRQQKKKHGLLGFLFHVHDNQHEKAKQEKSIKKQVANTAKSVSIAPEQIHLAATPITHVAHANTETGHESSKKGHDAKGKHKAERHERHKDKRTTATAKAVPVHPVITVNPVFAVSANTLNGNSAKGQTAKTFSPLLTVAAPAEKASPVQTAAPVETHETNTNPANENTNNAPETPVSLLAANGDVGPAVLIEDTSDKPQASPAAIAKQAAVSAAKLQAVHATTAKAGKAKQASNYARAPYTASTPLDRMMAMSQAAGMHYSPGLDMGGSSPDVNLSATGSGEVKVLKSGISQRLASIDLAIGKAEVLYLSRPATRVSVSNPDVATAVIISPTQIQLTGKAVGVANLLVWGSMNAPDHTVVDVSVHRDVSVLINQLKYVDPGIQIVPMAAEDTVILTGTAESRESAQLAIEMAKAFFSKAGGGMGAGPMPGGGNSSGPNSQAPGSAQPGTATNVINLMKIKGEPSTKLELVRQRMQSIDPNIHLEVVPGPDGSEKVILTGRVPTASIASKALNLASVFYGQPGMKMVTSQGGNEYTKLSGSTSSTSSSSSASGGGGSSSGGSGASADASGTSGANVLQGSIMTDSTGNVISMLEIAQKPQIRCTIKFLELNKTALNALGGTLSGVSGSTKVASWSGVQSAAPGKGIAVLDTQSPPGSGWSTSNNVRDLKSSTQTFAQSFRESYQNGITQAFTINNQLAGAIQALQERRQVRTLAEPTLTMLSGEQGSFLAGGEVPIAFVGGQGQVSIQYKEFGIRLNLLPNITDDGKIQMQLAPEVSSLDAANGVSTNSISVPAFVSRKMNTTLLVEQGQSFVLAGLYNQQDTDSMSRFPGLGSVPVLGSFFSNKWKNKTSSEMVVVIKPEIIYSNTGNTNPQPLSENPAEKHILPN
jgi:Flp pilus assembly secretin CpaC